MPLVIDPVLIYGTFLGGSADDTSVGIGIDSAESAYVTGYAASTNFPGVSQISPAPSGMNAFVAKLDVSGSSLVYTDYIGAVSMTMLVRWRSTPPMKFLLRGTRLVRWRGSNISADGRYSRTLPDRLVGANRVVHSCFHRIPFISARPYVNSYR